MSKESFNSHSRPVFAHADRAFLGFIVLFAAVVFVAALRLGTGTITQPGPGLWPSIVAVFTAVLAVVGMFIGRQPLDEISRSGAFRVLIFTVSMALFILLYSFLGFIPAAVLAVFSILKFVYRENWPKSLIVSALGAPAVYALFGIALDVPLNAIGS